MTVQWKVPRGARPRVVVARLPVSKKNFVSCFCKPLHGDRERNDGFTLLLATATVGRGGALRLSLTVSGFHHSHETRATIELLRYTSFWLKHFLNDEALLHPKSPGKGHFLLHASRCTPIFSRPWDFSSGSSFIFPQISFFGRGLKLPKLTNLRK